MCPNLAIIQTYMMTSRCNSQKELATKICEKPQVINEYESSKAVNPNQAILGKMERALEIKLRGKDKGAPLAPKIPKKAK